MPLPVNDPPDYLDQTLWSLKGLKLAVVSLLIILGSYLAYAGIDQISEWFGDVLHCLRTECNPKGPSASWQEQFAAADAAAHKIDPDAILTAIVARPAAYKSTSWHTDDALEVTFGYILNGGGSLTVRLWDIDPSNTQIEQLRGGRYLDRAHYTYYANRGAEVNSSLPNITISPRQALDSTSPTAIQHEILRGFDIQPEITFYFEEAPYSTLEWLVSYSPYKDGHRFPTAFPTKLPSEFQQEYRPFFTVEATSGAFEDLTKEDLTEPDDSSLPRLSPAP